MRKGIKAAFVAGFVVVCVAVAGGRLDVALGALAGVAIWYLRLALAKRDAEATLSAQNRALWVRSHFLRWGLLVAAAFGCGFARGPYCAVAMLLTVLLANWVFAFTAAFSGEGSSA